ncbi:hypothetical protein PYH37_003075 [Sinorhizobium numidicum]|uniref:Transposase n=1 Tax=Sinorhizobium numidicum TaxID=680248 RepID=A0ABY8D578_9HYPH|nr:hypothetical protein [Sinorhizobium numidicum]WEX78213.1 hypothetical protein PYH37_003075 [Sinorhizobium numidicum]WEX84872.1 hypothetical protein PYH38_003788 [Sinorhizobium numidicum]
MIGLSDVLLQKQQVGVHRAISGAHMKEIPMRKHLLATLVALRAVIRNFIAAERRKADAEPSWA